MGEVIVIAFEAGEAKSWVSLIAGLIIGSLGVIPLLNLLNVIAWTIPPIPKIIMQSVLVIGGVGLIIDGILEFGLHEAFGSLSFLLGAVVAAIGVISLLGTLGLITFQLGFITTLVIQILYIVVGIFLFIGAFMF